MGEFTCESSLGCRFMIGTHMCMYDRGQHKVFLNLKCNYNMWVIQVERADADPCESCHNPERDHRGLRV